MTTLVFVLIWVSLGVGLLLIALSGGPGGALQKLQSQSRGSRKAAIILFAISEGIARYLDHRKAQANPAREWDDDEASPL